jgi:ribosomal protein L32
MTCYICSKETDYKSASYAETVCLDCENRFNESDKNRRLFMEEYKIKHRCCPNCGSKEFTSTLAAYTYFQDNPEAYKDLNDCSCHVCGHRHTYHDRVPEK